MNAHHSLLSGMATVLIAAGLASCQKQGLEQAITASNLTKPEITVGLPPVLVAWTCEPAIPYTAYTPSDLVTSELYSVGFSINGKGYVLNGLLITQSAEYDHVPDLWMFDPATRVWSRQAPFPGSTAGDVGEGVFVIGDNAYVIRDNSVWQYNQPTNQWTVKGNFPGAPRLWGTTLAISGKGYLGLGADDITFDYLKDWWQYDPATDHWTRMADYGGAARDQAAGFASGGKGYVCLGQGSALYSTVWQYDPSANTWTQKRSLPGLSGGGAVAASGTIGGADVGLVVGSEQLWEYSVATDSWFEEGTAGKTAGGPPSAAFVIGQSLYIANVGVAVFHRSR